jgi:hypothetical protein
MYDERTDDDGCQVMAKAHLALARWAKMSSLTYIPGISVKFFFQPIYTDYAN